MEFDKNKVYTSVNADELKIGSKVICADSLSCLKRYVEKDTRAGTLKKVEDDEYQYRFVMEDGSGYSLAYFIEPPEEKKLKWSDLKIGDIIKYDTITAMVVAIDKNAPHIKIPDFAWLTDEALEKWEKVEK